MAIRYEKGVAVCACCAFPISTRRGREYCTGACRVRAKRVRDGLMTQARAEQLAREERERRARLKCGLPPLPRTRL